MASSRSVLRIAQSIKTRSTSSTLRQFHSCRQLLDENKPGKDQDPVSFRLSMYQSTFDRVQREKAEEGRIAALRAAENASIWPRVLGLTFGRLSNGCTA